MISLLPSGVVTKRDWTILGAMVGALVLVILLYVLAWYTPEKQKIAQKKQVVTEKQKALREAEAIAARKSDLEQEMQDVEDLVNRFKELLPSEEEIGALTDNFEKAAVSAGVRIIILDRKDTGEKPSYIEIPYLFSVAGGYHQIGLFINLLETSGRFFKVSDLEIKPQVGGVSEATFMLTTFRFAESI